MKGGVGVGGWGDWVKSILSLKGSKLATAKIPLINSIKVMSKLSEEASLLFLPPFSVGVNS